MKPPPDGLKIAGLNWYLPGKSDPAAQA